MSDIVRRKESITQDFEKKTLNGFIGIFIHIIVLGFVNLLLMIFMGVGALTDFSALIANPRMLLLGAAAQFGIFATLFGAILLNYVPGFEFTLQDASAIAIIGGADGPTAIFLASKSVLSKFNSYSSILTVTRA